MEYKGVYIAVKCKNRCFEKIIDEAIAEHSIDGVAPKVRAESTGSSCFAIYEWSRRLQRHLRRSMGKYVSKRWVYCPFCGEKL